MKIATVFSGIGAPEYTIKSFFRELDPEIVFACDCGETKRGLTKEEIGEIKRAPVEERQALTKKIYEKLRSRHWIKETYFKNFADLGISEEKWYDDIRFIDGREFSGKVDILIGGSPCQSFSLMGKRGGLEDARGTLFYNYAKLVKQIRPKVFVYENVPGMLSHDGGRTWETIQNIFKGLNYQFVSMVLNSKDFGMPQDRRRLFVVGFKSPVYARVFREPEPMELCNKMLHYLDRPETIPLKYFLPEKGFAFVTDPHRVGRAHVNAEIMKTQKRNQQFNWNGDFVVYPLDGLGDYGQRLATQVYVGKFKGSDSVARKLTPRECHRLMGFGEDFKICPNDVEAYKQAGNSIVINVFKEVFRSIAATGVFTEGLLRIGTLFSGIGAPEWALKRLGIKHEIALACDNGDVPLDENINAKEELKKTSNMLSFEEEKRYVDELYDSHSKKTNYVKETYLANYGKKTEAVFFKDVVLLNGRPLRGKIDLLMGGSPCQSFSTVGFQKGLDDERGNLFFEFARLVKEIKPRVFIYENVNGLHSKANKENWERMKAFLNEPEFGYGIKELLLNAKDFGIPQIRNRVFVIGVLDKGVNLEQFNPTKVRLKLKMKDFLETSTRDGGMTYGKNGKLCFSKVPGSVDPKYILTPAVKKYVTTPGTKNWKTRIEFDRDIARTLLSTMGNHHRAGVDNYVTDIGQLRSLTERECFRLMGFTDDFKIVVKKGQAYKQAGNSMVVDVVMALFKEIYRLHIL